MQNVPDSPDSFSWLQTGTKYHIIRLQTGTKHHASFLLERTKQPQEIPWSQGSNMLACLIQIRSWRLKRSQCATEWSHWGTFMWCTCNIRVIRGLRHRVLLAVEALAWKEHLSCKLQIRLVSIVVCTYLSMGMLWVNGRPSVALEAVIEKATVSFATMSQMPSWVVETAQFCPGRQPKIDQIVLQGVGTTLVTTTLFCSLSPVFFTCHHGCKVIYFFSLLLSRNVDCSAWFDRNIAWRD